MTLITKLPASTSAWVGMFPRGRSRVSTSTIVAATSSSRATGAPAATTLVTAGTTARVRPVAEAAAVLPAEVEVVAVASALSSVPEAGEVMLTAPRDPGAEDVPTSARPPTTAAASSPPPGTRETSGEGRCEEGGTGIATEGVARNLFTGLGARGAATLHTTLTFNIARKTRKRPKRDKFRTHLSTRRLFGFAGGAPKLLALAPPWGCHVTPSPEAVGAVRIASDAVRSARLEASPVADEVAGASTSTTSSLSVEEPCPSSDAAACPAPDAVAGAPGPPGSGGRHGCRSMFPTYRSEVQLKSITGRQ